MRRTLLFLSFFGLFSVIHGKLGFFNDISDEDFTKIEQLANYLRKHAVEANEASMKVGDDGEEADSQSDPSVRGENTPFLYSLPSVRPQYIKDPEFAVGPSDPRYYQDFVNFLKPIPYGSENVISQERESEGMSESSRVFSSKDGSLDENDHAEDTISPYHSSVYQSPVSDVIEAEDQSDVYFTAIVAGCSAAAVFAVVAIGISCYRLQKNAKAAAEVDYPAYGVTGPHKDVSPTSGDRRLAQSAQMYHYQHQKQQIIAMERASSDRLGSVSDAESDEENEEGDYTVYECPGLASTGEMEVKNPLFQDEHTPATPKKNSTQQTSKPTQHNQK